MSKISGILLSLLIILLMLSGCADPPPNCSTDDDCASDQQCSGGSCVAIEPSDTTTSDIIQADIQEDTTEDITVDESEEESCSPDCSERTCGPDPVCGENCGTCENTSTCSPDGICECNYESCNTLCCNQEEICFDDNCCFPQCDGRECGDDGCGGSCGSCPNPNDFCEEGQCHCEPCCDDKECGDNCCGGLCEPGCDPEQFCSLSGECRRTFVTATLSPVEDTYAVHDDNMVHGMEPLIRVGIEPQESHPGAFRKYRGYLRFDLSGLPMGKVYSARLVLWEESREELQGDPVDVAAHRLIGIGDPEICNWQEETINSTDSSRYRSLEHTTFKGNPEGEEWIFDVTYIAREWLDGNPERTTLVCSECYEPPFVCGGSPMVCASDDVHSFCTQPCINGRCPEGTECTSVTLPSGDDELCLNPGADQEVCPEGFEAEGLTIEHNCGFIINDPDFGNSENPIERSLYFSSKEGTHMPILELTFIFDVDSDGHYSDVDCNDDNPEVFPDATEICDGFDNNCDERIDEDGVCE